MNGAQWAEQHGLKTNDWRLPVKDDLATCHRTEANSAPAGYIIMMSTTMATMPRRPCPARSFGHDQPDPPDPLQETS